VFVTYVIQSYETTAYQLLSA